MTEDLNGTVALITGASSGIGSATARALAGRGAAVALCARRADRLGELAAEIEEAGGKALVVEADVTDRTAAEGAVQRTVDELGRLDTLVNNAGVMLLGGIEDADPSEWDQMVDLNVKGLLYVARAALPHLLAAAEDGQRKVADLVNMSSVSGRVAALGSGVYNLTKFGVNGFTESLRQEVTSRSVRVSLVEPGATRTELSSHNNEAVQDMIGESFDFEWMTAEDVADAVAYIVTRPRHVAVNELMLRPTAQQA